MKCPSSNPHGAAGSLPGVGQLVSSQCLLACVGSGGDTADPCVGNRHSPSRQSCVITRGGEQSRNQSSCFTGNTLFRICLCSEKTAIIPSNSTFPIICIWDNWNVSFGFQLLIAQRNIMYILWCKSQFQKGKGGS